MAVTGGSNVRDFRRQYRIKSLLSLFTLALTLTIIHLLILVLVYGVSLSSSSLWLSAAIMLTSSVGTTLVICKLLSSPLQDILAAIAHKLGEPTTTAPPNPNNSRLARSGLKPIIQHIYESSLASKDPATSQSSPLTESLNHTSCGVVVYGPDKQIVNANKAAPISHGQDGHAFLALNFVDEEDILTWAVQCDNNSIAAERRWQRVGTDSRYIKKQRFFDVIASYQKGSTGETIVFLIDQSERYLPEEEDLNFIAFAAHELRGPITVIRGYLDILGSELAGRLQDDEPELLKRLSVSANRLSSYINNILNVAKFDRHHLQIHLYEDKVSDIYATIADDISLRAATQARLLNVNIPNDLPTVAADRGSIGEVMGNLIDNAIKYSFEGGVVEVNANQKGDFVEVSIKDNGIGMPANVVSNLFRKFYRSHRSREAVAGTGIGLYICKAFVESHGGSISVNSRENEGSTFTFTLPTYASVADKLLEDGQLNQSLVRKGGGWIKNHSMYRR